MPKQTILAPMAPWVEIKTTAADWKKADPALLGAMLTQLHIIRAFEEKVLELAGEGLVHGPAHSSIGQEGGERLAPSSACGQATRSMARIAVTTSF